ncbi:unnamed protein product [Candidula unifasciata]|uniref:Voltage-dependent calcium channel gamma-7 subunit n=1 Tax=Candidula unifasciata TaxID=100452 RepID=A0A8S3Z832_9EUPU|nr:unnamed protein product [Candidula unifasciata]
MNLCTVYNLTVLSFVLGAVSVGLFALAVSTDSWLLTRESLSSPKEARTNVTAKVMWIRVWTGLWRLCMVHEEAPDFINCMAISYEEMGTGRGETFSTTSFAIIVTTRRAVTLPVSSLILAVTGVIFSVVGNIKKDVKSLVGGVLFILSGLSLAVGMILYISAINDEVGYRVSTSKQGGGGFSYEYGWSFFTAGFGFLASEMAAVVTVTLYLKRNSRPEDMARIIPGLEDKMTDDLEYPCEHVSSSSTDRHPFCHSERDNACFHLCRDLRPPSVTA